MFIFTSSSEFTSSNTFTGSNIFTDSRTFHVPITEVIIETDVNNSNNDVPLAEKGVKTNLSSLLIALIVVCTVAFLLVVFLIVAILNKRRMNTKVAPNVVAHNKNDEDDGNEFNQIVMMESQDADEFQSSLRI